MKFLVLMALLVTFVVFVYNPTRTNMGYEELPILDYAVVGFFISTAYVISDYGYIARAIGLLLLVSAVLYNRNFIAKESKIVDFESLKMANTIIYLGALIGLASEYPFLGGIFGSVIGGVLGHFTFNLAEVHFPTPPDVWFRLDYRSRKLAHLFRDDYFAEF